MFPILAWLRMGQWQSILQSPAVSWEWIYARILENFARGIAWSRLDNWDSAQSCLQKMGALIHDNNLTERRMQFNNTLLPATIARNILAAEIYTGRDQKVSAIF